MRPYVTCPVCRFETRQVFRDDMCTIALERTAADEPPGSPACPAQCCPNLWRASREAGIALDGAGLPAAATLAPAA
ncbi:MAG: hypothetical protein ABSG76_12005 [Xanthobacteraceae bacterium]|jgi:hypothetical protein